MLTRHPKLNLAQNNRLVNIKIMTVLNGGENRFKILDTW